MGMSALGMIGAFAGPTLQAYGAAKEEEAVRQDKFDKEKELTSLRGEIDMARQRLANQGSETVANISADASKYGADKQAASSKYNTDTSAEATRYSTDKQVERAAAHDRVWQEVETKRINEMAAARRDALQMQKDNKQAMAINTQITMIEKQIMDRLKAAETAQDPKARAASAMDVARLRADQEGLQNDLLTSLKGKDAKVSTDAQDTYKRMTQLMSGFSATERTKDGGYIVPKGAVTEFNAVAAKLGLPKDVRIDGQSRIRTMGENIPEGQLVLDQKSKDMMDTLVAQSGAKGASAPTAAAAPNAPPTQPQASGVIQRGRGQYMGKDGKLHDIPPGAGSGWDMNAPLIDIPDLTSSDRMGGFTGVGRGRL